MVFSIQRTTHRNFTETKTDPRLLWYEPEGEDKSEVKVKVTQSCPTLETPWTAAHQAPLSIEFSRQEHWSGLPFPSPGDLPNPGIEPESPALQADSLLTELSPQK